MPSRNRLLKPAEITAWIKEGRIDYALQHVRLGVELAPEPAQYHLAVKCLQEIMAANPANFIPYRLALLATFTIDPLLTYLQVRAGLSHIQLTTYVAPFNQVQQEILNPESGLYAFSPDMVILALGNAGFLEELETHYITLVDRDETTAYLEEAKDRVQQLVAGLRQRSPAHIVAHNFVPPSGLALGLYDQRLTISQKEAFDRLNAAIAHMAVGLQDVYVLDCARLATRLGYAQWFDPRMWFLARMPLASKALPELAEEQVTFMRAWLGLNRKCLVLDLDNTLWGGILGEDGLGGVQIGHDFPGNAFRAFQTALLQLHDRGVILAINSKNNESDVFEMLDQHPDMVLRRGAFAAIKANWLDKATNLTTLSQELNIGLSQMVFLDDNPVEREFVRMRLPQVLVPNLPEDPCEFPRFIEGLQVFDTLAWSSEDRRRNQMYSQESQRRKFEAEAASLEEFYAQLEMEAQIEVDAEVTAARVAQLTQRTNQFNLTTRRRTEAEIIHLINREDAHVYALRLKDRFGDYGLVGVTIIIMQPRAWEIDTFLLSCRVLGRTVEDTLLRYILSSARQHGARKVFGCYLPTAKNVQTAGFYERQGFAAIPQHKAEGTWWEYSLEVFRPAEISQIALHVIQPESTP